jgi:drug/metabolite transporter (DMT)-like permease
MTARPDPIAPLAAPESLLSTPSPGSGRLPLPKAADAWKLGFVALALSSAFLGYNWVVMKVGLRYSQPFTFAALRTFFGALSMFVLLAILRRPMKPTALGTTVAFSLLYTTIPVGLSMWALETGGAGHVSVLTYVMPFWLLILAWVFLGERLRGLQWPAVCMAFLGLLLVASPWRLHGMASSLMAVGTGLSLAASTIVAKRLYGRREVDILSFTTWQMLFGSLPLIIIAALTWQGPPEWSATFTWALLYNVLLAGAAAWCLWIYAITVLRAGDAGFGTLMIPVIGVVAAWIQLGERPAPVEAVGMGLIVCALTVLALLGAFVERRVDPLTPPL